jgi:hypothetical protein
MIHYRTANHPDKQVLTGAGEGQNVLVEPRIYIRLVQRAAEWACKPGNLLVLTPLSEDSVWCQPVTALTPHPPERVRGAGVQASNLNLPSRSRMATPTLFATEPFADVTVPDCPPGFLDWLAGFTDGEGSFGVGAGMGRHKQACICRFAISVRHDDAPVLHEIQHHLGAGRIYYAKTSSRKADGRPEEPTVTWSVQSKRDCALLCAIFDRHPLRAKKRRDYAVWRRAVLAWMQHRPSKDRQDWGDMLALKAELQAVRRVQPRAVV